MLARAGVGKFDTKGVQAEAVSIAEVGAAVVAIDVVAHDRGVEPLMVGRVQTQLVGAPRDGTKEYAGAR